MNLFALGICLNMLSKIEFRLNREVIMVWLISLYFIDKAFLSEVYPNILKLYLFIASILIIFSRKLVVHPVLQKVAYWLGLSSYLIYLLHMHLGLAFVLYLQSRVTSNIYIIIGVAAALITIVCVLLAIFIEKPMQRFLKMKFQEYYLKY